MNTSPENNQVELVSVDPELDRLYREHSIAAALAGQITQPKNNPNTEEEPQRGFEPTEDFSSTFAEL